MTRRKVTLLLIAAVLCAIGLWSVLADDVTTPEVDDAPRSGATRDDPGPTLRGRGAVFTADDFLLAPPPPPAPAGPMIQHRAQVVDADGAAVAGAVVHLTGPDEVSPLVTDAEGYVHATLRAGHYRMQVEAPGGRRVLRDSVFIAADGAVEAPLPLETAPSLRIRVLQGGEPLAGARFLVIPGYDWRTPTDARAKRALAETTTDASGLAEIQHLPRGPYELHMTLPTGGTQRRSHRHTGPDEVLIPLPGLTRVAGHVTDGLEGTGVANAVVRLRVGGGALYQTTFETTTDAFGAFELQVPSVTYYFAAVTAPGFDSWRTGRLGGNASEESRRTENALMWGVPRGQAEELRFPLKRYECEPVAGRVVTEEGTAVGGVTLTLSNSSGGDTVRLRVDPDGTFQVSQLPRGKYWAFVRTDEWVTRWQTKFRVPRKEDEPEQVRVVVQRATTLRGRVVDEDGRGVAGARVWPSPGWSRYPHQAHTPRNGEVITDGSGRFSIHGLGAGGAWIHAAWAALRSTPVRSSRVARDEAIVLRPAVVLRVVVRELGSGAGIPFARVRIQPPMKSGNRPERQRVQLAYECDAEGGFESEPMLPETWEIRAGSRDHLFPQFEHLDLRGKDGVLQREIWLDPGIAIAGQVIDAGGRPVAALLSLEGDMPRGDDPEQTMQVKRPLQTADDGTFRITGLRKGSFTLSARAPGHAPAFLKDLTGGEEDLTVTLKRLTTPPR